MARHGWLDLSRPHIQLFLESRRQTRQRNVASRCVDGKTTNRVSPDDKQIELRLSNYYLDVGFDLPSGGAFRVIDVIVTEAPRFNTDEH